MIISDVTQRRLVVVSMREVIRIREIAKREGKIFDFYDVGNGGYLVTLTKDGVGDYHDKYGTPTALAQYDKEMIKDYWRFSCE